MYLYRNIDINKQILSLYSNLDYYKSLVTITNVSASDKFEISDINKKKNKEEKRKKEKQIDIFAWALYFDEAFSLFPF